MIKTMKYIKISHFFSRNNIELKKIVLHLQKDKCITLKFNVYEDNQSTFYADIVGRLQF